MGKRNRADRRKARQEKAVSSGDIAALRTLCERNATSGAKALLRCLQGESGQEPDIEALELAARTVERLRADCCFELASELAAAGKDRSDSLQMQEAVAAFACGDDERVRALASQNADIAAMTAPWLAAVAGQRVPNASAGSSAMSRGILAVCRTVSSMVQGNSSRVRTALSSLGQPERGRLFVSELLGTVDLLGARADTAVARDCVPLARSAVIRARPAARAALAMTVARRAPRLFLDKLRQAMDLGEEATRDAAVAASCSLAEVDGAQAQVSQMIARLGAEAFAPSERANALLHEGFAYCGSDPTRARVAVDRAVALGADMVEALRGRLLIERGRAMRMQGSIGPEHGEALRSLMSSAMSLAQALERDSAGAPLATVALVDATEAALAIRQYERARSLVTRMRDLATRGGFLTDKFAVRLDVFEAAGLQQDSPARAKELVESALARDPVHHEAWHIRIDLEKRTDRTAAEDLVLKAAELKVCMELADEARIIRKARGIVQAFVPGRATAGELAGEFFSRLAESSRQLPGTALDDDIEPCRAALDPDRRTAFDMASIVILATVGRCDRAQERALSLLSDGALPVELQRKLLAAAIVAMDPDALHRLVLELAAAGQVPIAVEAVRMLIADDQVEVASRLAPKLAPKLASSELRSLQKLIADALEDDVPDNLPNPYKLVTAADSMLAPEVSLVDLISDDESELDSDISQMIRLVRNHPAGRSAALEQLVKFVGLPRSTLSALSASEKREFNRSIEELFSSSNPRIQSEALLDALSQIGVYPAGDGGSGAGEWDKA